jgi:dTDP-4-dehydrorhamnose 3,5-epimerase
VIFHRTPVNGVWIVEPDRRADARGWFARTFCAEAFGERGLATDLVQCSTSFNARRGTLRGLHWQAPPCAEAKLIRCVRGRVFDVAVDLRPRSPSFGQWTAAELSVDDGRMIYIPEGCAHGFQTLEDASELFYQISAPYRPALSRGVRWDDPEIGIDWPIADPILSDRDRALPCLDNVGALAC